RRALGGEQRDALGEQRFDARLLFLVPGVESEAHTPPPSGEGGRRPGEGERTVTSSWRNSPSPALRAPSPDGRGNELGGRGIILAAGSERNIIVVGRRG